jgi:hypothetical protein
VTHNASHIIIGSGRSTVSFGDPHLPPPANARIRVWHLGVALVVFGLVIGLAF